MGFLKVFQPGISEPSFQHVQSDMPSNLLSVKSCFPTPLFHRLYSVVQVCAPAFGRFMQEQEKVFQIPHERYITLVYLIAGKSQGGNTRFPFAAFASCIPSRHVPAAIR